MLVMGESAHRGEGGVLMKVREERQDNARGTRNALTSQTVTHPLIL